MRPQTLPEAQRANFSQLLLNEMSQEQEEEGVGPEEAFLRIALKTFGFDPDDGHYTDGAYDCGFDFVSVTQEETSIFQSKTLNYENRLPLDALLDASYLADLRRILEVLKDLDHLPREANKAVSEALVNMRNEITRKALLPAALLDSSGNESNSPEYKVNVYFVGLARDFTSQGREEFQRLEGVARIDYGPIIISVSIYPIFIDDILSEKWQQRNVDWKNRSGKKRDDVFLHICGDPILDTKSAVFFTAAYDLVQAYDDYGYQIFEPNVRCELKESKVNRAIKETVQTKEGRREFRHLNNGITLICTGWTKKQEAGHLIGLSVRKPGVVNGLQTVKSLHDAFRKLSQEDQVDFKDNCQVLCRVHQEGSVKGPEKLVKATNNQNPMKPRNLRSNDPEQIAFETLFASNGWFYERKQGAWDAFKADPRAWKHLGGKRPEHFQAGAKHRVIDNDLMAQNWLAFIGFSTEAINEKRTIFDKDEYYNLIFLCRTAKHGFDYDFKLTLDSSVWKEALDGSPDPKAMLAATLCRAIADSLALGRRENRETSITRLGLSEKSRDEQDRALDVDVEYQKQKILRGMLTLFVEFVGFVLFRALQNDFHLKCGRLLQINSFVEVSQKLDYGPIATRYRKRTFKKDDVIIILYCAFEHCVGQLYESNWLRGYNDAPVKNKYIYSVKTRKQLLEELTQLDLRFARTEWIRDWADGFNEAKGLFNYVRTLLSK